MSDTPGQEATTTSDLAKSSSSAFNVPNMVTGLRLVLSIVLFILMGIAQSLDASTHAAAIQNLYLVSMIVFLVAAGTDWVDGYWARRFGQVTVLGRIFDPFVDKVIICGVFVFLVASEGSQVSAWMAVVIVGRELLVTALRGFLEQQGTDFSASKAGKWKMVVQCAAAAVSLFGLTWTPNSPPGAWVWIVLVTIWAAVAMTVYSGVGYIIAATKILRR